MRAHRLDVAIRPVQGVKPTQRTPDVSRLWEWVFEMKTNKQLGRYLGITYLVVWAGSIISGALWTTVPVDGTVDALESIAADPTTMQVSAMVDLCITSTGIVVLAALLYTAVKKQNPVLALVALGWWIVEAATLAVSTVAAFGLVSISQAYVEADAVAKPHLLDLGDTLVWMDQRTWSIHMLFFSLGGLVWYFLMYQSRCVPRWLSIFGIAAVALALFSTVLVLATDIELFFLGFPTGLFELVIGVWLIVKGLSPADQPMGETEKTISA
jgi:hypothetical protein